MKYVMLGIFPILSNLILSSNCRAVTLGNKIRFCLLTSQCSSDLEGYWGLAKCSERSGGDCYQMWICPVVVLLITDTEIERDVAGSCIWSLCLNLWSRVWIWIQMEGSQHLCFLPDKLKLSKLMLVQNKQILQLFLLSRRIWTLWLWITGLSMCGGFFP